MIEPEIQHEGKTYRRIGEDWYDVATYISAPRAIAQELDRRLRTQNPSAVSQPKATKPTLSEGNRESTFQHAEAFPIIAAIIHNLSRPEGDYVAHHEIVAAFLAHPQGRAIADHAADQQESPVELVAGNIVAWFSKRFTEGETPYQSEFERERRDERWAYRATHPDSPEKIP